ncbi:TDP-N-acetylfucosamine:lipid II N-acetylfucosaminyltransferase [Pseudoalteromonas sp. SR44-5]|uniref:TDP-N-acetylfucosamine:lipid II N-acetylfucosaminyltransferase n=1 Tax=Pseudoalteromonas sp. SR44-5 TaxID=2760934 RepID=UPI0016037E85|nr:TDP-N-acetylfucosamine:lipid II N-acetylfucosaminyltransferase [Pseudoalteromonas sp. SR44-5]MBB1368463.1 TDP-N-acetylfucosamine:lipid II N-acetylfucosaminyltransferase [Pseudoalteromonas sp. SR44-5]
MKRILHVCSDEKFIDYAISNFKNIGYVENDFVVITNNESLKYIKDRDVVIKSRQSFLKDILLYRLRTYDAVVFHSMNELFKLFLKFIPKRIKVCWIGFGFDYYIYSSLIKEKNKKSIKNFIKKEIFDLDASYKKIDYFCPVLESEFESVALQLKLNAKYIDWNYGSSDKIVEKLKADYVNGDSILLGNSASETNNHIEIIDGLVKANEKREVVIPLSYGDNNYAEMIISKLSTTSLNYTILRDFLTQEEYFNILKRCSFVIMNHKRQQAAGNILIMLSLGAKVFLDKENPLYDYFKCLGFKVFNKDNFNCDNMSKDDVAINKELSLKSFNSEITINKTKALIDKLIN